MATKNTRDSKYVDPLQTLAANLPPVMIAPVKASTSPLTTGTLWTFTGAIEIMRIIGQVTTIVQAQATVVKLSVTNDALAAYAMCANTGDLTGAAVGSLVSITGTAAAAALITANGVLAPGQAASVAAWCTTSGVITVTYGAASTGAISWYMLWRPLSVGATVV